METYDGDGSILIPVSVEGQPKLREKRRRLAAVLEKSISQEEIVLEQVPFKNAETREMLISAMQLCQVFSVLVVDEVHELVSQMRLEKFEDQEVYKAGDVDDCFFVIDSGTVRMMDGQGNRKYEKTKGEVFGEMGLLSDKPRQFTVECSGKVELWKLTRQDYRNVLMSSSIKTANRIRHALRQSNAIPKIGINDIGKLVDCARIERLSKESGVERDEHEHLYIVLSGSVKCIYTDEDGEEAEVIYLPGDFFGDFSTTKKKRQVSIVANTEEVECIVIDRDEFIKALGPIEEAMNYNERLAVIQSFKGFDELDPKYLEALATQFERRTFQDGEKIIGEGQRGTAFYHIQSGLVKVHKHVTANETTEVSTLSAGQFFGETSLLLHEPCNADVTAVGVVECYVLSQEEFNNLSMPLKEQLFKVLEVRSRRTRRSLIQKKNELLKQVALDQLKELRILGSGKYGLVKLVQVPQLESGFALKMIQKGRVLHDRIVEELRNERNILMECDHPFIVKLYRTFQDTRHVYLLMDYIQGGELFSLLHTRTKFSVREAQFYSACLVEAISYLHKNYIVYRDLKPENTLIDRKGYLVLVDMGFARKLELKAFTMCGTPQYIAPEMLARRGYNRSVDYWTLGVMIYEFLSGETPFYDHDINVMYEKILSHRTLEFPEGFPEEGRDICEGLMRRRPRARIGMHRGGGASLKRQLWFDEIDWTRLYHQELTVPWQPQIKSHVDSSYFVEYDNDDNPMKKEYEAKIYNDETWDDF